MTGMQQAMLGAGGIIAFSITGLADSQTAPITATASATFNSDGTLFIVGNGSAGSGWRTPPATGIGAFYWIRLVVNSGLGPNAGDLVNTILALSSNRTWGWTVSNTVRNGNATITIYADAGATIPLASSTFSANVASI